MVATSSPALSAARSLSDRLTALGYTHHPLEHGRREVRRDGVAVTSGSCFAVTVWLARTGQIAWTPIVRRWAREVVS